MNCVVLCVVVQDPPHYSVQPLDVRFTLSMPGPLLFWYFDLCMMIIAIIVVVSISIC